NLEVANGATFQTINAGGATTHTISVSGSISNAGTLRLTNGSRVANLTFTGSANTSFTGTAASTTVINSLTLNKGDSHTSLLDFNHANGASITTSLNPWLILTNGTFRHFGSQT